MHRSNTFDQLNKNIHFSYNNSHQCQKQIITNSSAIQLTKTTLSNSAEIKKNEFSRTSSSESFKPITTFKPIQNMFSSNMFQNYSKRSYQIPTQITTPLQKKCFIFKQSKENQQKRPQKSQKPEKRFINNQPNIYLANKSDILNNLYTKSENVSRGQSKKVSKFFEKKHVPQTITIKDFQILKKLGEGRFGSVFLAKQKKHNFLVSLKIVKIKRIEENNFMNQFIRELKIQMFLDHKNIIKIYGFFVDGLNFYIVMELGSDGQLYKISKHKNMQEDSISFICFKLLEALAYLHLNKILHRDIKPENIVLVHGHIKLCDFGWAVHKQQYELRDTFCGTPLYLSPEALQGEGYDEKVDLWAVGILAYELYYGKSPFNINQYKQLDKILTQEVHFPKDKIISEEFKLFLLAILRKNPQKRLNSEELIRLTFIKKYKEMETCQELCKK